jgi:hypothetical protein
MSGTDAERLSICAGRWRLIERIRRWIGGWTEDAPSWWKGYREACDASPALR